MNAKIIFVILFLLVAGCSVSSIDDVKNETNVGKQVTIKGEVTNSVKLGEISGFILEDETGDIKVSSDSLPPEGEIIKVEGTLMKDTLLGYYIKKED